MSERGWKAFWNKSISSNMADTTTTNTTINTTTPVDHSDMKLGALPPKIDPRTLVLGAYLSPEVLPTIPSSYDWGKNVGSNWGMMKNDVLADCTIAGGGHMIMCWMNAIGIPVTSNSPTDTKIFGLPKNVFYAGSLVLAVIGITALVVWIKKRRKNK